MPTFSSSPSPTNSQQSPSNATTSTKGTTGRPLISSSSSNQGGIAGNTKTIYKPKLDTRALAEASKNLTQTLKQLSSEVLTTKSEEVRYFDQGYLKLNICAISRLLKKKK